MTDNRIQYFVPGLDDSFEKGWYQTNDNGVRLSDTAADADVFELGNLIVINAHTPVEVISAGAGNDVYLISPDVPTGVIINDGSGQNTIRFHAGIYITSILMATDSDNPVLFITLSNSAVLEIRTLDIMTFEFADINHALSGILSTANQLVDFYDDKPIFNNVSYTVSVAENITDDDVIAIVSGRDKTTADNALVYALKTPSDIFEITANGIITLKAGKTLDYEASQKHDLTVTISDGTNLAEAVVMINVTDIDDTAPVFARTFLRIRLNEGIANDYVIATFSATDVDTTTPLTYSITAGNSDGLFAIDSITGKLTLAPHKMLDAELINGRRELTITVTDGINEAEAGILMHLRDINIPGETITISKYQGTISLFPKTNYPVIIFDEGIEIVDFRERILVNRIDYMQLTLSSGAIIRVQTPTRDVTIFRIGDDDTEWNYAELKSFLFASADDHFVSDTQITFTNPIKIPYQATIAEDTASGTVIETVWDSTTPAGTTFRITAGNNANLFAIDASGVITLATSKTLDFETARSHTLTIQETATLTDEETVGGEIVTTTRTVTPSYNVIITVADINDIMPVVTQTGTATLAENAAGADVTGLILSVDDVDTVNVFSWSITDADGNDLKHIYDIVADGNNWKLKLKAGQAVDFEQSASETLKVAVNDGVHDSALIDITIAVTNRDDGPAIIAIAGASGVDLTALDIGDVLNASITTPDPDGVPLGSTGTWRWFHKYNPDVTIGTGDSYTLIASDHGANIGVEYSYTDIVDAANSTISKAINILANAVSRAVVTPTTPDADSDIALGDTTGGKEIDAGDGSDRITGGAGNDKIIGGLGDDNIDLGTSKTDTDIVIYGIGGRAAKDGNDNISNFNRGIDQLVFALDTSHTGVSAITDYDSFLTYVTKGTATLDDDEFRVQLVLGKDSDGNGQIEGLLFHFASTSFYSGGRLSLPLMKISFANPIDTADIQDIFTNDAGEPADMTLALNRYYFITDLEYLDDFMGDTDSISYEIA